MTSHELGNILLNTENLPIKILGTIPKMFTPCGNIQAMSDVNSIVDVVVFPGMGVRLQVNMRYVKDIDEEVKA